MFYVNKSLTNKLIGSRHTNIHLVWKLPHAQRRGIWGPSVQSITRLALWIGIPQSHQHPGIGPRMVTVFNPFRIQWLNRVSFRYECKVVFLNRSPNQNKNGTWFHLDVHAPPRFVVTPEDVIYVNLGDAIILNCQAEGKSFNFFFYCCFSHFLWTYASVEWLRCSVVFSRDVLVGFQVPRRQKSFGIRMPIRLNRRPR